MAIAESNIFFRVVLFRRAVHSAWRFAACCSARFTGTGGQGEGAIHLTTWPFFKLATMVGWGVPSFCPTQGADNLSMQLGEVLISCPYPPESLSFW